MLRARRKRAPDEATRASGIFSTPIYAAVSKCRGVCNPNSRMTMLRNSEPPLHKIRLMPDARCAGIGFPGANRNSILGLKNKGFRTLVDCGVPPRCCDYDLRLVTNPSPVSIELRASDVARGDLIPKWRLPLADRSERIYRGRIGRFARSIRYGWKAREVGKPADRLLVQRSAR